MSLDWNFSKISALKKAVEDMQENIQWQQLKLCQ